MENCTGGEIIVNEVNWELCPEGTYTFELDATSCKDCMEYATCEGGDVIYVHSGYWRPYNDSEVLHAWDNPSACLGGYGIGECATGYEGNLCRQWAYNDQDKYIRRGQSKWEPCPSVLERIATILSGMWWIIGFSIYMFRSSVRNATTGRNYEVALLRIFLHHFTCLVIIKKFDLNWPDLMQYSLEVMSFLYEAVDEGQTPKWLFDTEIAKTTPLFLQLIFATFLPITVVLFSWGFWVLCGNWVIDQQRKQMKVDSDNAIVLQDTMTQNGLRVFKNKSSYERRTFQEASRLPNYNINYSSVANRNIFAFIVIILYVYNTNTLIKAISLFSCRELESGETWLNDDLDVRCWQDHHTFYLYRFGLPTFIITIILVPLCYLIFLLTLKRKQKFTQLLLYWGLVTNGLKENYIFWDFIQHLKKFLLLILNSLLIQESLLFRALVSSFIIIIFNELLEKIKPWKSQKLQRLEYWSNITVLSTIYAGIFFSVGQSQGVFSILAVIVTIFIIVENVFFLFLWLKDFRDVHRRYFKHKIKVWSGIKGKYEIYPKLAKIFQICKKDT